MFSERGSDRASSIVNYLLTSPDNERGLFVESDIEYPAEIKRTT